MPAPAGVTNWLIQQYPKPRIDPQWLDECYAWIEGDLNLDPTTQLEEIIQHVESQLLQSDLRDSMLAGTGLPANVAEQINVVLNGPPVLVEIIALTEIGHSAFSLQQVRQNRLEHADLVDLGDDDQEDEGPIPKYPHSMLKMQLSDGTTTVEAIEYRRLPQLNLGETPLGFKMLLKNVPIRRGIAFLEPRCVIMKGHHTADRDALQDVEFARSLRQRLGQPEDPAQDIPQGPLQPPPPQPPPAQAAAIDRQQPRARAPPAAPGAGPSMRSPFRELSEPPELPIAGPSRTSHDDDEGQPRRRKLPAKRSPSPPAPARAAPSTHSRFFANAPATPPAAQLAHERLFSPPRQLPLFAPDSDEEDWAALDALEAAPGPSATLVASAARNASPKVHSSDFDYDFDAELGEQELLALEQAEREAALTRASSVTITTSASPSTLLAAGQGTRSGNNIITASSSRFTIDLDEEGDEIEIDENANPAATRSGSAALPARIDLGVITIESSDEDDKENVPLPTRHVRRRMDMPPDDVIELSD